MSRFIFGIVLAWTAWMVIGATEFNENYVFANPGIVVPKAANMAQWSGVVAQQEVTMSAFLSPFKYGLPVFLIFIFPPLCMLTWRDAERLHKGINAVLLVLLMLDIYNLMQFNGNNGANGGYDGDGELVCYGLHGLFSVVCIMLFLIRIAWCALNSIRKKTSADQ